MEIKDKSINRLLDGYQHMIASRLTDKMQADAAQRGEVILLHSVGAGHEASALIAPYLTCNDWLHLHYRDRALAYARCKI